MGRVESLPEIDPGVTDEGSRSGGGLIFLVSRHYRLPSLSLGREVVPRVKGSSGLAVPRVLDDAPSGHRVLLAGGDHSRGRRWCFVVPGPAGVVPVPVGLTQGPYPREEPGEP